MTEVFILKDLEDGEIDAVITRITPKFELGGQEKLQSIINTVKNSREDWNIEDIRDALPDDYEMVTRWDSDEIHDLQVVTY